MSFALTTEKMGLSKIRLKYFSNKKNHFLGENEVECRMSNMFGTTWSFFGRLVEMIFHCRYFAATKQRYLAESRHRHWNKNLPSHCDTSEWSNRSKTNTKHTRPLSRFQISDLPATTKESSATRILNYLSIFGNLQRYEFIQEHSNVAIVCSKFWQILNKL